MTKTFFCSWCGKSDHEVAKLLAGPNTFICNECVELCMDILRGDKIDTIKTRLADDKLREVITHEVREAFRQHESAFAAIVKTAVDRAFADLLKEPLP